MAITHVQTPAGGAANAAATSLNLAFGSNVAAGSLIVVGWRYSVGGSTVTCSDTQSNTYANAVQSVDSNDSNSTCGISYAMNAAGGACTVTFSISGGVNRNLRISVSEFSGAATTSALDQTSQAAGNSTAPAAGSVTPGTNGQLLFAVAHTADVKTYTAGTDFTLATTVITTAGSQRLAAEYYVQPTAAAHNGNFTATGGVNNFWGCSLATFKAPSGVYTAGNMFLAMRSRDHGESPRRLMLPTMPSGCPWPLSGTSRRQGVRAYTRDEMERMGQLAQTRIKITCTR